MAKNKKQAKSPVELRCNLCLFQDSVRLYDGRAMLLQAREVVVLS